MYNCYSIKVIIKTMLQQYSIIIILLYITITHSFKFNNIMINKDKLRSYCYNNSKYSQMELINWNENIDYDRFYYIVGHKNLDYYLLVNEIQNMNYHCIFIPISTYKLNDIDFIFRSLSQSTSNDFIKPDIKDINEFNNFLIFDQNKYIGGLFEMYSILYKDT